MTTPAYTDLPAITQKFVAYIIDGCREQLQKRGQFTAMAFGWNQSSDNPKFCAIPMEGPQDLNKAAWAAAVREVFAKHNVDTTLLASEVWMKTVRGEPKPEGQVRDMPGRIDAVMFSLETASGAFWSTVPREDLPDAEGRYTFGPVVMEYVTAQLTGNMVGLRPVATPAQ
jgi:hypothetical protein